MINSTSSNLINSSLERPHGDHSYDTFLFTVTQIFRIFVLCFFSNRKILTIFGIKMITINAAKIFILKTYLNCGMSCTYDKSTKLVDNERVINGLFRPND